MNYVDCCYYYVSQVVAGSNKCIIKLCLFFFWHFQVFSEYADEKRATVKSLTEGAKRLPKPSGE
jgi:hypothetical protein